MWRLHLDLETLDLVLKSPDLAHKVRGLVGGDGAGDDGPGDTTSAAQSHLGGNVDVGNVLVLAKQGQMQKNGERGGVCGEHNEFGNSAIQRLRGFVLRNIVSTKYICGSGIPTAPFLIWR
jgi:hypothetical protein